MRLCNILHVHWNIPIGNGNITKELITHHYNGLETQKQKKTLVTQCTEFVSIVLIGDKLGKGEIDYEKIGIVLSTKYLAYHIRSYCT